MNELLSLVPIIATALLVAAPIVTGVTLLARGAPSSPVNLFRSTTELPWPRGVQEEEPRRWRVELVDRRRVDRTSATAEPDRRFPAEGRMTSTKCT